MTSPQRPPAGALGLEAPPNPFLQAWVERVVKRVRPDRVFWCNGSELERDFLTEQAVGQGILIPLNPEKLPGCYLHRSDPNDVARVEDRTFICTRYQDEAGPTNNWAPPHEMYRKLYDLLEGSMEGRILYVVPYLMGPAGSNLTKVGVEITDSIYVVLNMRIMSRMGQIALDELARREDQSDFNRGIHCTIHLDPEHRYICHFPEDNTIISVNSGYGGNVLLGKKCLALRIGSFLGREQGWMAEHMLLLGVESPTGEKSFVAAAFPSACGKTNFAMLIPPPEMAGWKITTVGDDIAWMQPGPDGRLMAINPEAGYFGVAPGTSYTSNPNAMRTIQRDTIYTNVALTDDGDVWWEGKDGEPPAHCIDWRGNDWTPASKEKAAHPNSRFTAPMINNPVLAPEANDPAGVPISAIIFGGRRATTIPLVFQAFNWIHGVYLGATMGSETTAAAGGAVGHVRRDPMAMLPFCGYSMSLYFSHWLHMQKKIVDPPAIFHVNWFRKDANGKFLWPGFGDNMRVLKWIIDRCRGRVAARETSIGFTPRYGDFDTNGLAEFDEAKFAELQKIDHTEWVAELLSQEALFIQLHQRLPKEMVFQRELLLSRLV